MERRVISPQPDPRIALQPCISALQNILLQRLYLRVSEEDLFKELVKHKTQTDLLHNLFANLTTGMSLRRPVQISLFEWLFDELVRDIKVNRGILSVQGIINRVDQLPLIIDESFPGYMESGLFPVVLQALGA